jgi:hypothetical protein
VPSGDSPAPAVLRGRFHVDDRQRRVVVDNLAESLKLAVSGLDDETRPRPSVDEGLGRLSSAGQEGTPLDIHIRLFDEQLEVEVLPEDFGQVEGHTRHLEGPVRHADRSPEFRTWLLRRLQDEGLSQESAARRIGVSTRTVGRWARGHTQPRMRDLARVREALGELPAF